MRGGRCAVGWLSVRGLFAMRCAARDAMQCAARGLVAGGAMLLTEGFLGWLSRFKLIRLRRISLATLPRYGRRGGRRDGTNICIACLRQVVAFAPKVIISCIRQGFCIRRTR